MLTALPAAAAEVEILLGEDSGTYREVADHLRRGLLALNGVRISMGNPERRRAEEPELTIAVGTRALSSALASRSGAILAVLVPRGPFDRLMGSVERSRGASRVSAVFVDQPAARQLNLIRLVLPGAQRIGVLYSPAQEESLKLFQAAARTARLTLVGDPVATESDLYPSLVRLMGESDALLATPDAAIFNSGTIHNILLTTFRARRPVFGFSPAYVRAGALAALYSTPRQMAEQAVALAAQALAGSPLPPPQYPHAWSVDVNETVARSLGMAVPDGSVPAARLMAMEREQ